MSTQDRLEKLEFAMMMVVWLVAVMLAFAAKVLLLSLQVGANKGKVVKFDSSWLVGWSEWGRNSPLSF